MQSVNSHTPLFKLGDMFVEIADMLDSLCTYVAIMRGSNFEDTLNPLREVHGSILKIVSDILLYHAPPISINKKLSI